MAVQPMRDLAIADLDESIAILETRPYHPETPAATRLPLLTESVARASD